MKFRYVFLTLVAVAGFGASLAIADDGHGRNGAAGGDCKHGVVLGTLSGPQTFTLTVDRANDRSGLKDGQVVTVALGAQSSQVRMVAEGCVGTDGTLTVRNAELHARNPNGRNHEGGDRKHGSTTTTVETTTTSDTTASTTTHL